ncbi:hypothetical protein [Kaarinaea lacus]
MKTKTIRAQLLCLSLIAWLNTGFAAFNHDPDLTWQTLRSEHFVIHFHDEEEELANRVAAVSERAYKRVTSFFQWQPREPTQIVLMDRMDFSNAFAYPTPRNTIQVIVTPPDDFDTIDNYHDCLDLVITHEYTHIVHVDKVAGLAQGGRNIFGRHILFFPNALQPPWVLEGIATYLESQIAPGIGRGQNSSFRALMRLEVESGLKPLSQVNLPIVSWPAGITRYLYGMYFFNYLMDHYDEQQVQNWFQNYSDNLIPYAMNSTAKQSFEKNIPGVWKEYEESLRNEFQEEIAEIRQKGLTTGKQLTQNGYTTGPPRSLPNGDIIFVKEDWLGEPVLMRLPFGASTAEPITKIHGTQIDVHPEAGALVVQIDRVNNTNFFSDLHRVDLNTGKTTQLTHGRRYKHATWSPDSQQIIAVQTILGKSALHLLTHDGQFVKTLWQGQDQEIVSELDWSPDGRSVVASVWRPGTRWNLELFDIQEQEWTKLTNTRSIEFQPQFSSDGKTILFSADYDNVFNIYRLEPDSGTTRQLTNVMGAALSATESVKGQRIYYLGLNAGGNDIYALEEDKTFNQKLAQSSQAEPYPPTVFPEIEYSTEGPQDYFALDKISPTAWFPYLSFTDNRSEFGINVSGNDPLNWHQYSLTAAYDFKNHWPLGWFTYHYDRWRVAFKLSFSREIVTVLDAQDQLNSFRNSDTLTAEALLPFLTRDRQLTYHLGVSSKKDSDKEVQAGGIPLQNLSDNILGLALSYNSAKFFPRGVSLDDGVRWRVVAEDSDTLDSDYTGQVYTIDWSGYFNLSSKHVLATRLVAGWGSQTPNPFRLGGTRIDSNLAAPTSALFEPTTAVFNKREYPLRGYPEGLTGLTGPNMLLGVLEWRFPLKLIESGIMVPPVGIRQIHGTLFYSTGDAWNDDVESADYRNSAGLETEASLFLGYFIPMRLRLGYAHGFNEGGEDQVYIDLVFSLF